MATLTSPKHYWNYFLALMEDLEKLSRYIEFSDANMKTYSIELTHVFLSASSEVDVVMKELCSLINPSLTTNNINDYKNIIKANVQDFVNEEIHINRYGLSFKPWDSWSGESNPDWWKNHNNVKHQRNKHFSEANLENTIEAVGALLITVVYYYKYALSSQLDDVKSIKETVLELNLESSFIKMDEKYYYSYLVAP